MIRFHPNYAILLAPLLACWAAAQTPMASVTGVVRDATGAVVPGAAVQMVNRATGVAAEGRANESGIYLISFLTPGPYLMTVEAPGFRRHVRSNLTVETGQRQAIDVMLEIGEVAEEVTVTAAAPLLQSATSSINQLLENATIVNMPLASRRVASLVRLLGNVTFSSEDQLEGLVNFSLAGGRSRQQAWQLDGGNVQGSAVLTGILEFNPPVEALQEVKVEANGYPAEFGRSMGGLISMTSKSGANRFSGVLYEYLRNDVMDARSFFAPSVAPRRYNVFGGSLGGPIRKDRTHFFSSYEGTRRRDGLTRTYNVPTPAEIRGDFSAIPGTFTDPANGQPFPGKIVPASRFDPAGSKFASLYPVPNVPGAASASNNFRANVADLNNADSFLSRLDHVFRADDRIHIRHVQFLSENVAGNANPIRWADPNARTRSLNLINLMPGWFHSFGPTLFNELRFTLSNRNGEFPALETAPILKEIGMTGVPQDSMPQINVTGLTALGLSGQQRDLKPQRTLQATESLSWFRGKHNWKLGGEWRRSLNRDAWGDLRSGSFSFNERATGTRFALANLLLGRVTSASVNAGEAIVRTTYYAAYLQDDWKVTSRLTLNIGLRWDMDTPRWETRNQQNGFDPVPINPVSNTPGIVTFSGRDGLSKYAHRFDKNNFGPRFGFAWRPAGEKTVVRGAYGVMFGPIYDASMGRVMNLGFGDVRSFSSPDGGLTPAFLLRSGVPTPQPAPLGPGLGAVPVGRAVEASPGFIANDHANTYAHHFNFTLQRQVFGTYLAEAGYLANLAHKVGGPAISINEIRPELRGAVQDQRLRPFPQYSAVTWLAPNWGNSSYHALNLKLEKRFSGGLNMLNTFTWSKFIDDVQANSELAGNSYQSYYARRLEKALSGNDIRYRWASSFVYELPAGKGRKFDIQNRAADHILGGWSLGLITELRTGSPYGVYELSNRLNAFGGSQRSDITGDPHLPGSRPRAEFVRQWFDTSVFAFPGNAVLGNSGKAVGYGPGFANFDASLLKDFRLGERPVLQLRGEFFNLFNRANFNRPNTSRGGANFGTISSTRNDGRFIQVGLRLSY